MTAAEGPAAELKALSESIWQKVAHCSELLEEKQRLVRHAEEEVEELKKSEAKAQAAAGLTKAQLKALLDPEVQCAVRTLYFRRCLCKP